jgi:hypothetical protein
MQPPIDPVRAGLTAAQVVGLIRDAAGITVGAGCELLDQSLQVLDDISADFAGGSVSRAAYSDLHGTCSVGLSRELAWGRAIIRPYMTITDGVITARFNLGAYFTSTPKRDLADDPVTYAVAGYDILHGLRSPVGESFSVDTGASYLEAVEDILAAQGYTAYVIDQSRASSVLPAPRNWPIDPNNRWLTIVNDLLAAIGYQGIWSDWDGRLRVQPYLSPMQRTSEWLYNADVHTAMMDPARVLERDFFEAPNRWVAVRSNNIDGAAPVEGNGIYTFVNEFAGDTSVEGRGGRVITRILNLEAADHATLVAQAQVTIDADTQIKTSLAVPTSPNPLHWHFDRMTVDDPDVGPSVEVLGTQWTLPLNGDNMSHSWTFL